MWFRHHGPWYAQLLLYPPGMPLEVHWLNIRANGPKQAQSNGGGGSIPLQCEISATYVAKVIRKLQLQSYRSITPSRQAVEDFNDLCLGYFQDKVVSDTCSLVVFVYSMCTLLCLFASAFNISYLFTYKKKLWK